MVAYSAHSIRHIPSAAPLERTSNALGRERRLSGTGGSDERGLIDLVTTIETANSRAVAVAALNEFIGDADQESSRGATIPSSLARVCLTLGVLLGVLAVAQTLGDAGGGPIIGRFGPALVAATAGLMGGLLCYQLGQQANRRRSEYREQVRRLAALLEQRLPPERPERRQNGPA